MINVSTNSALFWNFEQLSDFDSAEIDCTGKSSVNLTFEISSVSGFTVSSVTISVEALAAGARGLISPAQVSVGGDAQYNVGSSPTYSNLTVFQSLPGTAEARATVRIVDPPSVIRLVPTPGAFPTTPGTGAYFKASANWS